MNKENAEAIEFIVGYIQTATIFFWIGCGHSNQTGATVTIISGLIYFAWRAVYHLLKE